MQGAINAESNEALLDRLDQEKRWGLSAAQRLAYAAFLSSLPEGPADRRAYVLENYHLDSRDVMALCDKTSPHHNQAWGEAKYLVENIIRKNTYIPINDRSLEAADLLQNALGEIAGGLGGFRHQCRLTTWIHQVTLNSLRRGHRDRNAQRRRGQTSSLADNVAEAYNPIMEEARHQALIAEMIDILRARGSERHVIVFQLAIIDERRLVDIGQHLCLSTTRVHNLLKDVRQMLCADASLRDQAAEAGIYLEGGDEDDYQGQ